MARKSQSCEQRLKKKREAERKRYALMKTKAKEDPNLLQEMEEISRQKYKKRRLKKQVKLTAEMTARERRLKRKQWRKNTAFSRQRITFPQTNTPPESGEEELEIVVDKEKKKVGSKKDRELKKKDTTIKKLKQKLLKYGRVKICYNKGRKKKQSSAKIERDITAFFEDERNSRILHRKKDVIKSASDRQQVQYLEDDMNNLYEKFKTEDPSKRENIIYGTNSDDGDDLNLTIKTRNTNIDLNSNMTVTVLSDIYSEEDFRVEYLVRCSKEHDFFKGIPNSVNRECSVSDIIDIVLNPTII
ncbi:hypothetical protein PR048_011414 [Dryococelus australis]|uniref:Uncharacterized protein n=1 Tax=Dryococelus australis TaxID=614101 RepID=A0ABQ9HMU3_9NEOP|nr:hypothetical protein PR048_011414 [Dryococelus australis]